MELKNDYSLRDLQPVTVKNSELPEILATKCNQSYNQTATNSPTDTMKNVRKEKREGKKSPWGVLWTDSGGKRRSKFFRTKELRDTYASDLEGTLNKHGASALDVDLDLWRKYCDLQTKLGETPIEHAVEHYLMHAAPKESITVNEAKQAFYENRQQAGCVDDYLRHVEKELGRFAKRFGERKLTDITVKEISTWIFALPYQNVTRRNYHTRLHAMWEYAILREWATSNPVHKVPKPKVKRKEPTTYTVEETEKILNKAWETDRSLVPYLALALFAGMRSSALDRLEFHEIDLEEKYILIPEEKAKNEERAIIQHLPENLWAWLQGAKRADFEIKMRDYYKRRERVLLRAEVPIKKNVFRHCFASYHVNLEGNANKTALILTHANDAKTLFKYYHKPMKKKDAEAYFDLVPPGK